jgi:hypothetical protein
MMVERIKLGMDWGSYPVWGVDDPGDFPPEELPLSQPTIERLKSWQASYNSNLNWDDPMSTPPTSDEQENAFLKEGLSLWQQLIRELSPEYEVFYDYYNQLLKTPQELEQIIHNRFAHLK